MLGRSILHFPLQVEPQYQHQKLNTVPLRHAGPLKYFYSNYFIFSILIRQNSVITKSEKMRIMYKL